MASLAGISKVGSDNNNNIEEEQISIIMEEQERKVKAKRGGRSPVKFVEGMPYETQTCKMLRNELVKRGLRRSGIKADLIERLKRDDEPKKEQVLKKMVLNARIKRQESMQVPAPEDVDLICGITQELFEDPVVTCDGHTYSRRAIERWFRLGKDTSPNTGLALSTLNLHPSIFTRKQVLQYRTKKGLKLIELIERNEFDRVVSMLDTDSADLEVRRELDCKTPLLVAAEMKLIKVVELLIENGANCFNVTDEKGIGISDLLPDKFSVKEVNELRLKHFSALLESEFPKGTAFVVACEKGRFDAVKFFITNHDVDGSGMTLKEMVNQKGKDSKGWEDTPIVKAARGHHFEIVHYLVKHGANVYTALRVAEDETIIDYLFSILLDGVAIDNRALNAVYANAFPEGTPFVVACEKGRLDDVKVFVTSHDVDGSGMTLKEMVNQKGTNSDGEECSALDKCIELEQEIIIDYLVDVVYANTTELVRKYKKEWPGSTPLVVACQACDLEEEECRKEGNFEDVKVFVTSHDVDESGMTLKEMINQVGVDIDGRASTALEVAEDETIIDYLFSILLDGVAIDNRALNAVYANAFPEGTPFVVACEKGRLDDVKVFVTSHDVDGSGMTLKEMVNQKGTNSDGMERSALFAATGQVIIDYLVDVAYTDSTELVRKYKKKFPQGTPFIVACEKGQLDDVKAFVTNHDVDGNGMALKEMINQVGANAYGQKCTALFAAGTNQQENVIGYLIDIVYPNCTELVRKYVNEFPKGTPFVVACEKGRLDDVKVSILAEDETIIDYLFSILLDGVAIDNRALNAVYANAFPEGTPFVVACEKGRLDDVKVHDVDGSGMTLKEMVNQKGTISRGSVMKNGDNYYKWTGLMAATRFEQSHIVQYLLEDCKVDATITNGFGLGPLHLVAGYSKVNTDCLRMLLENPSVSINATINSNFSYLDPVIRYDIVMSSGRPIIYSALQFAYISKDNITIKQELIALLRRYGAKCKREGYFAETIAEWQF
eukprot:g5086.t1